MKLKEIPQNTVVHTPTEEEAKELLAILHENGWINIGCVNYVIKNAKGIQIESETNWSWWEKIENARKENYTILTLAEFKEKYCEEEKPQPKFKVGDWVRVKNSKLKGIIKEPYSNDSGYRVYFEDGDGGWDEEYFEGDLEPYTEPEPKPTEDMETKELNRCEKCGATTQQCMDAPCQDYPVEKELNLVELLKGHDRETFWSPLFGDIRFFRINTDDNKPLFFEWKEGSGKPKRGCPLRPSLFAPLRQKSHNPLYQNKINP